MDLNWKAFNAINKRTSVSLCNGEVGTLTPEEVIKANTLLLDMNEDSEELYNLFELARNRFRHQNNT